MKHILSVLVENKPGVLSRVTGLISRRGFNIESLSVGPTEDPTLSRVTAIVLADDVAYEQITKERSGRGDSPAGGYRQNAYGGYGGQSYSGGDSVFQQVRYAIQLGDLGRAEALLTNYSNHNAEWNFLKGVVCARRGWMDEAKRYYETACQMDPGNLEYQRALDYMENGPRQAYTPGGTTFGTDLCGSNLCLPMCCLWSLCSGGAPIFCCI